MGAADDETSIWKPDQEAPVRGTAVERGVPPIVPAAEAPTEIAQPPSALTGVVRPLGQVVDRSGVPVDPAEPEDELSPIKIPDRLARWLDKAPSGPRGDLYNALIEQRWVIVPASDPLIPGGADFDRAYPPGFDVVRGDPHWPWVPLPATLDSDRALRNTVIALQQAGEFDWEDR